MELLNFFPVYLFEQILAKDSELKHHSTIPVDISQIKVKQDFIRTRLNVLYSGLQFMQ